MQTVRVGSARRELSTHEGSRGGFPQYGLENADLLAMMTSRTLKSFSQVTPLALRSWGDLEKEINWLDSSRVTACRAQFAHEDVCYRGNFLEDG